MADRFSAPLVPAPLVALAAWLVPGLGYMLIGQWARGITIGVTIIGLFLSGLLVAGVRVMEVPGYTDHGERRDYRYGQGSGETGWVLKVAPLSELRDKPWSVPQVMAGPIAIATAFFSVHAAQPMPGDPVAEREYKAGLQGKWRSPNQAPFYRGIGVLTHARINDIGSLYLSVAGLLNLMAIIDSAHRASRQGFGTESETDESSSTKAPA